MADRPADGWSDLVAVMARLRAECDWKAAQTHRSLARYLLEETHETLEALDTGDLVLLREELGDLLLQVLFHCAIAAEAGEFDLADVSADLRAKLVRRNPHVFGTAVAAGPVAVNELWESVKAAEKRDRRSVTDGLPDTLPALLYADKVLDRLDRLARAGGPVPIPDAVRDPSPVVEEGLPGPAPVVEEGPPGPSVPEELAQQASRRARNHPTADLGDRLLALVAEARASGTDPEQALRDAVRRLLARSTRGAEDPPAQARRTPLG